VLTSWSGAIASSDSTFTIDHGPVGAPRNPLGLLAGVQTGPVTQNAGADTPLAVQVLRSESDQKVKSLALGTRGGLRGGLARRPVRSRERRRAGAWIRTTSST
jgi:hypothetical protein